MRMFNEEELACHCCQKNYAQEDLIKKLDILSEYYGKWFTITSGWRCEKYNKAIGGAPNSEHVHGWAVDIAVLDSRMRFLLLKTVMEHRIFDRIGIGGTFLHLGCSPDKDPEVVWLY